MVDLIQKFLADHAQVILVLVIVNVVLSAVLAACQQLQASPYASKVPGLAKIISVVSKISQVLSANLPHDTTQAAAVSAQLDSSTPPKA